jgi:hypothetical protein
MAVTFHSSDLILAIGTAVGEITGGIHSKITGNPLGWLRTDAKYPALVIHPILVSQSEVRAQVLQTYLFNLYYVMVTTNLASPESAARARAEEIAANLMAVPRLGVTAFQVDDSIVTGIAYDNEVNDLLRADEQGKAAVMIGFQVTVREDRGI